MESNAWHDLGPISEFQKITLTEVTVGRSKLAISFHEGMFGALSGMCNHIGGPLGQGRLAGEYATCPWHNWKFHCKTGAGEPGFEEDAMPSYEVRVENGRLLLRLEPLTQRNEKPHVPHPLARPMKREEGPVRVVGIPTTAMDHGHPRYSTSEALLKIALEHAEQDLQCETRLINLNALCFRDCESYYSKSAQACT